MCILITKKFNLIEASCTLWHLLRLKSKVKCKGVPADSICLPQAVKMLQDQNLIKINKTKIVTIMT